MSQGRERLSPAALAGLLIGAAIMVAPLVWTLLLSLKSNAELMRDSAAAFSPPYTLENYHAILAASMVPRWLLNSLIVSLGTTAGVLVLCSLAGYGFARLQFPFRAGPARPRDPGTGGDPAPPSALRPAWAS